MKQHLNTSFRIAIIKSNCLQGMPEAIQQIIEQFGARVLVYSVQKQEDLIRLLSGELLFPCIKHLIFCFRGEKGQFVLPQMKQYIYWENTKEEIFTADDILSHSHFNQQIVINTGNSLGNAEVSNAFLAKNIKLYIGCPEKLDESSKLMFIIRFYYEILAKKNTVYQAFQTATKINKETSVFQLYSS